MMKKILELPFNNPNPTKTYSGDEAYERVTMQLQCGNCTSFNFEILQGSWITVAKCLDYLYEYCVHEG